MMSYPTSLNREERSQDFVTSYTLSFKLEEEDIYSLIML